MPPDSIAVVEAGRTVRICAQYRDTIRGLVWICVQRDCSVYTFLYSDTNSWSRPLAALPNPDGGVSFEFAKPAEDGVPVPTRSAKVSFHASGVINAPSGRTFGIDLRHLHDRTLLCQYLFQHPSRLPLIRHPRPRDLVIRRLFQDECPVAATLFFQPAGAAPILDSDLEKGRFVLPLGYVGVEPHERAVLTFVFSRHTESTVWPSMSAVAWPRLRAEQWHKRKDHVIEPGA